MNTQGTEHVSHLAMWSASTWGRAICSKETGGAPEEPKFLFGWSNDVNGENVILYSLANAAFAAAALPSFLLGPAKKKMPAANDIYNMHTQCIIILVLCM
jgi:hypothetical protein